MAPSRIDHLCKLYRASEHYNLLDYLVRDFLQPNCYEIAIEHDVIENSMWEGQEFQRAIHRRRVYFKRDLPLLYWGTIVGDFVHNLRSALDHIIYVISHRRDPVEFANDNTTAFPICDSPNEFNGRKRRDWQPNHEIRGLPDDAKAIVEALQPYNRGNDLLSDPLRILREMDDIDKHRAIHLTGWSAVAVMLDITHVPYGTRIHSHSVRPVGGIESGDVLAQIEYTFPLGAFANEGEYIFETNKQFYFTVTFDEGTPLSGEELLPALFDLYGYVEGVVNALHRFVPQKVKR